MSFTSEHGIQDIQRLTSRKTRVGHSFNGPIDTIINEHRFNHTGTGELITIHTAVLLLSRDTGEETHQNNQENQRGHHREDQKHRETEKRKEIDR
jgi:hypothetical protein